MYLATGSDSAAKDGCDVIKLLANEKEARARPDWWLWKQAIKEEMAAHKKPGTWSTTQGSNEQHKAVNTRFVFAIEHEAEGQKTRYEAWLMAQGFNQVPGRDFCETWAPVTNTATSRALLAVAASNGWEVHHVEVRTAFCNAKMDKEMYIKLPEGVEWLGPSMSTSPTTWFATTGRAGMWPSTSSPAPICRRTGSPSRFRGRRSRLFGLPSGLVKIRVRLRGAPSLATPNWGSAETPWRQRRRPVAEPGFCGRDLRRRCCGPESAVDGCVTVHLLKAGNGARLHGAPTRGTAGWDRPGALRRHCGRPVGQPWVRGWRPCRFW